MPGQPCHRRARILLRRIYHPRDAAELRESYDLWAEDYDGDMARGDYRLPGLVTALTARHVPAGAGPVLDAGAGTGLLGEWLALAGYPDLEALDLSEGMLRRARMRRVYGAFHRAELGGGLPLEEGRFAAVASAGAFGITHAPASGFRELLGVTRPGGHLVLSIRVEGIEAGAFEDEARTIEDEGLWRRVETLAPFRAFPQSEGSLYVVWVFRRS